MRALGSIDTTGHPPSLKSFFCLLSDGHTLFLPPYWPLLLGLSSWFFLPLLPVNTDLHRAQSSSSSFTFCVLLPTHLITFSALSASIRWWLPHFSPSDSTSPLRSCTPLTSQALYLDIFWAYQTSQIQIRNLDSLCKACCFLWLRNGIHPLFLSSLTSCG